jgi:hypothetical protein
MRFKYFFLIGFLVISMVNTTPDVMKYPDLKFIGSKDRNCKTVPTAFQIDKAADKDQASYKTADI